MLNRVQVRASEGQFVTEKSDMLIKPAFTYPGLARGTIILLGNSITVRITEQHKRIGDHPATLRTKLH
ncbi:hypothetical protein TNCV_2000201 [Trichonephila clavipes]|nr:hypothetical protein TNCV_2000201 [Trichonephila clavipes]